MWKELAPVLAMAVLMMVPIVKMFLSHQQKMAELVHRVNQQPSMPEQDQLRQELRDLKTLVHQQSITLDNLTSKLENSSEPKIEQRLGGVV
ncbi:MAG: hypothetical protein QOJ65_2471 [Fimbriimonadaceae bacterium]|jgi:hypothetical protein|nr:hypothetical protein [Fimbriimonadaceae bacterium]